MGSVVRCSYSELYCPMGEIAEDLPSTQSDSDLSSSSLESGEPSSEILGNKCRWIGCGLWFGHLDLLASHVTRVHAECGQGGLFYCGWEGCTRGNRGFNARYKMLVHVRTHTNEKPHQCFKCEKSFSRAENLKIHARSHTGERPYVCPVPGCGKAYSNSSDRFKHTRTHSVDKPYMCKVPGCSKRYTDPSSLRKHVKTYRHYQHVSQDSNGSHEAYNSDTNMSLQSIEPKEKDEDTKESTIESQEERILYPKDMCNTNNCFTDTFIKESQSVDVIQTVNPLRCSLDTFQFHQWPRPEYNLFCSWLSIWNKSFINDQEQILPLDLTVHHGSKTESSHIY